MRRIIELGTILLLSILIAGCSLLTEHTHNWSNGKCTKCQKTCTHQWEAGSCKVCGLTCAHLWDEGTCGLCGEVCEHVFTSEGVCAKCGVECRHEYNVSICTICHHECEHSWDMTTNKCRECGLSCPHYEWSDGYCRDCGYECWHHWTDHGCSTCGKSCEHKRHDAETKLCMVCGTSVEHLYYNQTCIYCGKNLGVVNQLPEQIVFSDVPNKGNIYTRTYETKAYMNGGYAITKEYRVYLPYGYNESTRYNVLILLHGSGGSIYDWLDDEYEYYNIIMRGKDVVDRAIYYGVCDPLILVVPTTNIDYVENCEADQIGPEMIDLLQNVAMNYTTYIGNSPSYESMVAARAHLGIAGLSNGSLAALRGGLTRDWNIFGYIALMSGDDKPEEAAEYVNIHFPGIPCGFLLHVAGEYDSQQKRVNRGYQVFIEKVDAVTTANSAYIEVPATGHDTTTWYTGLYDCLTVFFKCICY